MTVRVNRFRGMLPCGFDDHQAADRSAVQLLRSNWGDRFTCNADERLVRRMAEQWEVCDTRRNYLGTRSEHLPAKICLRLVERSSLLYVRAFLLEAEFFLSIGDVATQLKPTTILLPDHLVLVCGGSSLSLEASSYQDMLLRGPRTLYPVLTVTREHGTRRLQLDFVERMISSEQVFAPVGLFINGQ
jgi:hypothetical protein